MLLRKSISSTKKFFRKTIGTLKSLFSGENYQKLPKYPLEKPILFNSCDIQAENSTRKANEEDHIENNCQSSINSTDSESYMKTERNNMDKKAVIIGKRKEEVCGDDTKLLDMKKKSENNNLVEEKLKELEMLDMSDVDHVLDIEEVLHYYSRLTCPAYVEIVDNFFVEILAEFLNAQT